MQQLHPPPPHCHLPQLVKHTASVRCLDLSATRNKLAVVDENAAVLVYNLLTKEKIFEVRNGQVLGSAGAVGRDDGAVDFCKGHPSLSACM